MLLLAMVYLAVGIVGAGEFGVPGVQRCGGLLNVGYFTGGLATFG